MSEPRHSEGDLHDTTAVPGIVEEQWRIQVCHIARLARARCAAIVGWEQGKSVVYAAGRPGKIVSGTQGLESMPAPDFAGEVRQFTLRSRWPRLFIRCRAIPLKWPDGVVRGALVLTGAVKPWPRMEESYRFMAEETLRLGLQSVSGTRDPLLSSEVFARMVRRYMDDRSIALLSISADGADSSSGDKYAALRSRALSVLARRMASRIRETDFICGQDGRFLVLMRDARELSQVAAFSQKLLSCAREDIHFPERRVTLRISIGVAFNRETVRGYDQLVRQAQAAMYQARRAGADRFVIFNAEMR
ncbi:MAG: diguanylate cyclase [Clostridiales bacterium]|nr:diguanylate cyclase [Clostridiales bacterium]